MSPLVGAVRPVPSGCLKQPGQDGYTPALLPVAHSDGNIPGEGARPQDASDSWWHKDTPAQD